VADGIAPAAIDTSPGDRAVPGCGSWPPSRCL
jgi:hypothetical protein